MRDFVHNERGVVFVGLVLMIVLCITFALMWIATMPAVGLVWDIVNPNLPVEAQPASNMLNNVMGWALLIMVVGTIIYGAAWATRRDPVDVPYYG